MRRAWRWMLGVVIAIVLVTALVLWLLLGGSLADLDGEHPLPGLAKPVTIERDGLGVVTITARAARPMRCARWAACMRRSAISRWT